MGRGRGRGDDGQRVAWWERDRDVDYRGMQMVGGKKTGGEGGWQLGRKRDKGMLLGKIAKGEGRGRKGEMDIDRRSQWLTVEVAAGDDAMVVGGSVMDGDSGRRLP